LDDLFTAMSVTWLVLENEKREPASFLATDINQQLEILKGGLHICDKDSMTTFKENHDDYHKDNGLDIPRRDRSIPKSQRIVKRLWLRVDPRCPGRGGSPNLSFWTGDDASVAKSAQEVKTWNVHSRTRSRFWLDMPICPASHNHCGEANQDLPHRVPSIVRISETQVKCDTCTEVGYVSVQLLLLRRANYELNALVLAPVLEPTLEVQDNGEEYQRLGLLCDEQEPWQGTVDGVKFTPSDFWELESPSTRRTITII
jgi:hypothetical protein